MKIQGGTQVFGFGLAAAAVICLLRNEFPNEAPISTSGLPEGDTMVPVYAGKTGRLIEKDVVRDGVVVEARVSAMQYGVPTELRFEYPNDGSRLLHIDTYRHGKMIGYTYVKHALSGEILQYINYTMHYGMLRYESTASASVEKDFTAFLISDNPLF